MEKTVALQAFVEAVHTFAQVPNYRTSQREMLQEKVDKLAADLINLHGVDPEQLDDIYFSIV